MKYLCLFMTFVFLGCEQIIEIDPPEYNPEPVVTGLFSTDSVWTIKVHRSLGITVRQDATIQYIPDASVRITNDLGMVDVLEYQGNGDYVSSAGTIPIPNVRYTLHVDIPEETRLHATATAPPRVEIANYSFEHIGTTSAPDPFTDQIYRLMVKFSDVPGPSFYRVGVYRYEKNQYSSLDPSFLKKDSFYVQLGVDLSQSTGWACGYVEAVRPEPTSSNAGGTCDESVIIDNAFDGESYSWTGIIVIPLSTGRRELILLLSSLSQDYFEYIRTQSENYFFNPLSEPVQVHSNIEGGLGVFAGYTNTTLILPFD